MEVLMPKFDTGQVVMTRGVEAALDEHPQGKGMEELYDVIFKRHVEGDWCDDGDLDEHDLQANKKPPQERGVSGARANTQ